MEHKIFQTGDGCRIAYRFDGPAHAPVLLLSNSLGTAMGMWDPQMEALTAHARVLRYDMRGHGKSGVPDGAYSLDRLGRDVVELLDGLEIGRVDFCGLSLGGMVGQWLGIRAPDRLRRLILANTSSYMGLPADWDVRIELARANGMSWLAATSVERWFTPEFRARNSGKMSAVTAMLLATDASGYVGCCAAIRDMDMRPTVGLIDIPTLVIGGTADPATPPPHSEALAEAIARARLVMLDAAHLSNVEQADAFGAAMLSFFR